MRTLYTSLALFSLLLVALVATAAPSLSFNVDCTLISTGVCAAANGVTFDGTGLNPKKTYMVTATLLEDPTQDFVDGVAVNSDGTFSVEGEGFVSLGTWTFTLTLLGHDGLPQRDITAETFLFQ